MFEGIAGREREKDLLLVESVGSAVLDAAAERVLERAVERGVGADVAL